MKKIIASLRDSIRSLRQEADCNPIATDDGKNTLSGPRSDGINEVADSLQTVMDSLQNPGTVFLVVDEHTGRPIRIHNSPKPMKNTEGRLVAVLTPGDVLRINKLAF